MELHDDIFVVPEEILHETHLVPSRASIAARNAYMLPTELISEARRDLHAKNRVGRPASDLEPTVRVSLLLRETERMPCPILLSSSSAETHTGGRRKPGSFIGGESYF